MVFSTTVDVWDDLFQRSIFKLDSTECRINSENQRCRCNITPILHLPSLPILPGLSFYEILPIFPPLSIEYHILVALDVSISLELSVNHDHPVSSNLSVSRDILVNFHLPVVLGISVVLQLPCRPLPAAYPPRQLQPFCFVRPVPTALPGPPLLPRYCFDCHLVLCSWFPLRGPRDWRNSKMDMIKSGTWEDKSLRLANPRNYFFFETGRTRIAAQAVQEVSRQRDENGLT